eukprot:1159377-Pelagomonas_calceolata.AAC.7
MQQIRANNQDKQISAHATVYPRVCCAGCLAVFSTGLQTLRPRGAAREEQEAPNPIFKPNLALPMGAHVSHRPSFAVFPGASWP